MRPAALLIVSLFACATPQSPAPASVGKPAEPPAVQAAAGSAALIGADDDGSGEGLATHVVTTRAPWPGTAAVFVEDLEGCKAGGPCGMFTLQIANWIGSQVPASTRVAEDIRAKVGAPATVFAQRVSGRFERVDAGLRLVLKVADANGRTIGEASWIGLNSRVIYDALEEQVFDLWAR